MPKTKLEKSSVVKKKTKQPKKIAVSAKKAVKVKKDTKAKAPAKTEKKLKSKTATIKSTKGVTSRTSRVIKPKTKKAAGEKVKKAKTAVLEPAVIENVVEKPVVTSGEPEFKKKKKPAIAKKAKTVKSHTKEEVESPKDSIKEVKKGLKELEIRFPVTVKDLSVKLNQKPSVIIKIIMQNGVLANINQTIEEELANKISENFGFVLKKALSQEEIIIKSHEEKDKPSQLSFRAPVITLMGHVDHGKTSLLDAIRKSKVTEKESGGITQHIGAYVVNLDKGKITFLDTPGHEAFTAMRSRGAHITDIVILVVAADDGLMPQTEEAIDHARAAGVPIVVAINKIDRPQADIDKVKKQLAEHDLNPEDWGGKTITVEVSAKTGEGIDNLLEMILLEAEMLELKANPNKSASGIVIDAKLSKGRGSVATILVQNGTLHTGDTLICGKFYGRTKAMFDDLGKRVQEAVPSTPIEVTGLSGVPLAGEQFHAVEDEQQARQIALERQQKLRLDAIQPKAKRMTLEDISSQIKEGSVKELNIILKTDVQGSLGALEDAFGKMVNPEVQIKFIHKGIGNINVSDVILASASNAVVIGFHIDIDEAAREIAKRDQVDIRTYNVIYEAIKEVRNALEGLLDPRLKKIFIGTVIVREVFKLSKSGLIAGCFVQKGKIMRSSLISVVRGEEVVFEGKVSSLKRFKNDVKEVEVNTECGLAIADFTDYQPEDIVQVYEIEKIARKL
ncbi:MAG TPA: translation initiation factor IF-2 [Candidatus Omnitrophica bacterium]|nr:translation initiation factor IF-2 [Candidatus Omnitrophota bacterium]